MHKKQIKRSGSQVQVISNLEKENTALLKKPDFSPAAHCRIAQVFLNCDLRNNTAGLLPIAKKQSGIKVEKLPEATCLVFINHMEDRFKLIVPARRSSDGYVVDWYVLYYQSPHGRITLESIQNIPRAFGGRGNFSLASEGEQMLGEELRPKRIRSIND